MKLDPLVDLLEAADCGTSGETIFTYKMPVECVEGILLQDSYFGTPIDWDLPGYRRGQFRLVTRSRDWDAGNALAQAASDALTMQQPVQLDGMLMKQCLPQNDPRSYHRSAGNYWEFEVDFNATHVLTP
jgi:hypothetical protein